jgi:hypothetical protein
VVGDLQRRRLDLGRDGDRFLVVRNPRPCDPINRSPHRRIPIVVRIDRSNGRGLDDIEFATMTYVDWFNQRRLHGEITSDATYTTPAEAETDHYRQTQPAEEAVTQ